MFAYIVRRLVQAVFVLFIVLVFTFTLPYFEPHGILAPAYVVLGTKASAVNVHNWGVQHGMYHPYLVRLWDYIVQVVWHHNIGFSYKQNLSVWGIISLYVPRTVWLALTALVLTFLIAVPLGIFQANKRNTVFDYTATGSAFILYAIPLFLLCLLVLQVFSFGITHLPASPPSGVAPWAIFTDPLGFILPVGTLTIASVALLSRFMRGTVLEVLVQDYVRTARAKGCSNRLVGHAFGLEGELVDHAPRGEVVRDLARLELLGLELLGALLGRHWSPWSRMRGLTTPSRMSAMRLPRRVKIETSNVIPRTVGESRKVAAFTVSMPRPA